MNRIERVIGKCDGACRYFEVFESTVDNFTRAKICRIKPGLIAIESCKDGIGYEFPPFCPLEDYAGDETPVYKDG
jgi:hypothetical protein